MEQFPKFWIAKFFCNGVLKAMARAPAWFEDDMMKTRLTMKSYDGAVSAVQRGRHNIINELLLNT